MSQSGTCLSVGLHEMIPTAPFPVAVPSAVFHVCNNEGLFSNAHNRESRSYPMTWLYDYYLSWETTGVFFTHLHKRSLLHSIH